MEINYDDLASKMEVSDDYIKGELMSVTETEEETGEPESMVDDSVSFYFMGSVLYEVAPDHSISQTVFKGGKPHLCL